MADIIIRRAWATSGLTDGLQPVGKSLTGPRYALKGDATDRELRLTGGRWLWFRFIGGWLLREDNMLPKHINANLDDSGRVLAVFASDIGGGIVDRWLRTRYERALSELADAFEQQLQSHGATVEDITDDVPQ